MVNRFAFPYGSGGQFGFGLAIIQRLVQLYSGRIWAANENGGIAYYLEIPTGEDKQGDLKSC